MFLCAGHLRQDDQLSSSLTSNQGVAHPFQKSADVPSTVQQHVRIVKHCGLCPLDNDRRFCLPELLAELLQHCSYALLYA